LQQNDTLLIGYSISTSRRDYITRGNNDSREKNSIGAVMVIPGLWPVSDFNVWSKQPVCVYRKANLLGYVHGSQQGVFLVAGRTGTALFAGIDHKHLVFAAISRNYMAILAYITWVEHWSNPGV